MKELMFFDANCQVGDTVTRILPGIPELLKDMDRYGVDRALVRHTDAGMLGAVRGNRKISDMLEAEDPEKRLVCVWNVLPDQCPELPPADEFFALMKEKRAGALTLDPVNHRFIACRLSLGRILGEAAKRRVPVLLNCFAGKWEVLYSFLKEFPELVCIIHGGDKWGRDRYLRPLLDSYPGLHGELSGYWVPEGIAELAGIYGAERLLYASGFPRYNHGAAMLQLRHSGLDDKDIALIAGKNLENLVGALS